MKCQHCSNELDLLEIVEKGRVYECSGCAYTITLKRGFAPKILYNGPPPIDLYYHD